MSINPNLAAQVGILNVNSQLNSNSQSQPVPPQTAPQPGSSTPTQPGSSTATSSGLPTLLNPFVVYNKAALTLDGAWHTLAVTGVPSSAKWMYVGGYVMNDGSPDNQRQTFSVRPNSAGQTMMLSMTNGVNGSYENDCAIGPCIVPCVGANVDYNWSDTVNDTNFIVYGYI